MQASDKLDQGLTKSIKNNYIEGSKVASAWDVVQKEVGVLLRSIYFVMFKCIVY